MLDAVAKFLIAYAPGQTEDKLYRGNQNRMALPQEIDYTIFDIDGTQRVGTNVGSYAQAAEDRYEAMVLREYTVQVDFFSHDNMTAAQRATAIETIGRSHVAVDFFKEYGIGFNYCDDVQYIPYTDLSEQYVYRYRVVLHMTKWEKVSVVQDYAEEVVVRRIENIDGHHPVTEIN